MCIRDSAAEERAARVGGAAARPPARAAPGRSPRPSRPKAHRCRRRSPRRGLRAGPYRRAGAGIRTGVTEALRQFVALIREPDAGRESGRDVYVGLGRGELRQGRTLDSLQSAYRVGARVAWRRISAAARRRHVDTDQLAVLAEAIFAYIDELSTESPAACPRTPWPGPSTGSAAPSSPAPQTRAGRPSSSGRPSRSPPRSAPPCGAPNSAPHGLWRMRPCGRQRPGPSRRRPRSSPSIT